jgi:hypothetical protein
MMLCLDQLQPRHLGFLDERLGAMKIDLYLTILIDMNDQTKI